MAKKLLALALFLLILYICWALLLPVAMGGIFAVLLFPLLAKLERRGFSTGLASALLSFGMTLIVALPALFSLFLAARAGILELRSWTANLNPDLDAAAGGASGEFGGWTGRLLNMPLTQKIMGKISIWFPVQLREIVKASEDFAKSIGLKLADALGTFLAHLPSMALALVITVLSTYFLLVDARKIVAFVRRHSFYSSEHTERLIQTLAGTTRSVILAVLVSGVLQAFVFAATCLLTGTGNAFLVGFAVFIGSFVPVVGAAPVTIGIALAQLFSGLRVTGVILLFMAGIVAVIDNLVRPIVLRGGANLHPLLAFISVFGGLQVFGFAGLFLGPIIVALGVAALKNYTESAPEPSSSGH